MLKNNNIDLFIDTSPIENLSKDEYIMRKFLKKNIFSHATKITNFY